MDLFALDEHWALLVEEAATVLEIEVNGFAFD